MAKIFLYVCGTNLITVYLRCCFFKSTKIFLSKMYVLVCITKWKTVFKIQISFNLAMGLVLFNLMRCYQVSRLHTLALWQVSVQVKVDF